MAWMNGVTNMFRNDPWGDLKKQFSASDGTGASMRAGAALVGSIAAAYFIGFLGDTAVDLMQALTVLGGVAFAVFILMNRNITSLTVAAPEAIKFFTAKATQIHEIASGFFIIMSGKKV